MRGVRVLVGTRKGAFILESGHDRRHWEVRGPLFGAEVFDIQASPQDPDRMYAAVYSAWSGVVVRRSTDGGHTWETLDNGFAYEGSVTAHPDHTGGLVPWQFKRVWRLTPTPASWGPERVFAGVEDAALFRLEEPGGWTELSGLRQHPSHHRWAPGAGGLCLHTVLLDPGRPGRMYAGISAAGVFRSDDGGVTWRTAHRGLRASYLDVREGPPDPELDAGYCVHKVALHPAQPEVLFLQAHEGVYRSDDAGESWQEVGQELPSEFGFALAVHPHDPGGAYVVPMASPFERYPPGGTLRVWRTRDGGHSWQPTGQGLPERHCYVNVLRDALGTDALDPCGVYLGTTGGQLFASADEGSTWSLLAGYLPPVLSVHAAARP